VVYGHPSQIENPHDEYTNPIIQKPQFTHKTNRE